MATEEHSMPSQGISKRVSSFFAPCSRLFNRLKKNRWSQNSCCLCDCTWTVSCSWVCGVCDDSSDGNCHSRNIPGGNRRGRFCNEEENDGKLEAQTMRELPSLPPALNHMGGNDYNLHDELIYRQLDFSSSIEKVKKVR